LLPVLFSIHGGAFEFGGADLYGLSATRGLNLLKNGVILVAIQYRLAVLGRRKVGFEIISNYFRICLNRNNRIARQLGLF
jgi:hypothetical protein